MTSVKTPYNKATKLTVRESNGHRVFAVEPLVEVDVVLEQFVFIAVAPDFGLGIHCVPSSLLCDGLLDDGVGEVDLSGLGVTEVLF